MKIGIVLSSSPGYSETFFTSKILGLQNNGHHVILFCQEVFPDFSLCDIEKLPSSSTNKFYLPFKVIKTYFSLIIHLKKVYRFYRLERQAKTSLKNILKKIYLNAPFLKSNLDWLHFGFGTLALGRENISQAIGCKMAVSFRGFDIGVYPIKHPNCYDRLWEVVDKIHVISDDIKELLYMNDYKDQAPVIKITPAIDVEFFRTDLDHLIEAEEIQIITIARLHWKKGLDYTLEALAILKEQGVPFTYTIIGDGNELEYLKFTVYQLGLTDNVTFTGKLAKEEIKERLDTSHLYLQYSVQEGFCNAVLEAQSMGLLCVVSNAEGLAENVLHEETGWIVPMRQPKLLAKKIGDILNLEHKDKVEIISNAKKRVKEQFTIEFQKVAFITFYKDFK
ncbi:glycosyltransferase [Xanthomarina sp. GH4-25]|uniref:glycosyltransferase n=1 Tax=Xanthomarina sp. GH4-25 TaxID=3349335 RepID=UPI003877C403